MTAGRAAGRPGAERATAEDAEPTGPSSSASGGLPDEAYVAALLALPGMGPARLRRLVGSAGSAAVAWAALRGDAAGTATPDEAARRGRALRAQLRRSAWGRSGSLLDRWVAAARELDPASLHADRRRAGVHLLVRGSERYPARLLEDPEPPALLFARGRPEVADLPTVAVVGTRRATPYGREVARRWGATFAAAGVAVVSGLASGIDAAAHAGAVGAGGAPPIGVVGTGLDVIYPRSSTALWADVTATGLLVSETPLGGGPEPWRFPARNRIIAGLADVLLVVESHAAGGALLTADEALSRQMPVFAVPGSVHSPASVGCHRLVAEGALLATTPDDVLAQLPWDARDRLGRVAPGSATQGVGTGPGAVADQVAGRHAGSHQDPRDAVLLDALGWEPVGVDELVDRTGWSLGTTTVVLERLLRRGRVTQVGRSFIRNGESCSH